MGTFFRNIFLLIVLCSSSVFGQSKLQYRLNIGDSITIVQEAQQNIVQNAQGIEHNILNDLQENYTFKVISKTDTTYTLKFHFNRFKLKTTSNQFGVMVDVDTDAPTDTADAEGKIFSGLTASELQIIMSYTGEIIQVDGTEEMIQHMISLANVQDEFTKQLMIESMKSEFGSKSLSKSFEQLTFIYPDKAVTEGDTWTNEFTGDIHSKNTWKLKNISDTINMDAESTLSMIIEDQYSNLILKGKQNIVVKANKKTGFINEMTVNAKASNISGLNNPQDNFTTLTSKTTYKIY